MNLGQRDKPHAAEAQKHINSLCNMQKQLIYLASADPNQNNTQFAANLQAEIQTNAGNDLSDMWSALEGNGVLGTRSLINEWSDLVGPGPGYPIFANVSYLKSAVPNLQYYQGAMLVGYNLQVEQAHWLELNGAFGLAKSIIEGSSSDFEQHNDTEMKLVAHNQEIAGPGSGLYAAALPPFFAAATQPNPKNPNVYNSDPTNAYNWSIDTRNGLMWMRSRSCDGPKCTFAMYDQEGGFGSGVGLAQPYISNINTTLSNSHPGELLALTAPSRAQWIPLLRGLPFTFIDNPSTYLASIYFFGVPISKPKLGQPTGKPDYDHFWTSDIGNEAPGARLFPAWGDWHIDTSVANFGCCEPTENLELVSAAPLTDPYHFLYRSHQDDFSMNVFAAGPAMGVARAGATATPLLNGKVLIASGATSGATGITRSTELYDPVTRKFTAGPPVTTGGILATATRLPNGRVLIAGGYNLENILASTQLYDPNTNTFAAAPAMNDDRAAATATLLPDGKVLIAGGSDSTSVVLGDGVGLKSAELYDPYGNTFAPAAFAPVMNYGRSFATATSLPNGKVLIAGGIGEHGQVLDSTELYDPATDTFTTSGPMTGARYGATAAVLPDSEVLIAGGEATVSFLGSRPLSSTDFYTQ